MYRYKLLLFTAVAAGLLSACAYRPYAGDLEPVTEAQQGESMTVADDGTITYIQGRLEIRLRAMTDEELNRQFGAAVEDGTGSVNPYTFGNTTYHRTGETPRRFTVFLLGVKNYEYPKVQVTGDIVLESSNGRRYYALNMAQLGNYYRAYAIGYRGNEYELYKERRAILNRTMFPEEAIFSGQEEEGYLVFEPLADDVAEIDVTVHDIVVRFDYRGEPVESIDVTFGFERDVGKAYPDGRIELSER